MSQPGVVLKRAEPGHLLSVRPGARQRPSSAEVYVRQWLARELHDGVAQVLTGMVMEIEQVKAEQTGRRGAQEALDSLQASTRNVLASVRQTLLTLRGEPTLGPNLDEWLQALLDRFHAETGIDDYALLWSVKEYKKTRVRYFTDEWDAWRATHLTGTPT